MRQRELNSSRRRSVLRDHMLLLLLLRLLWLLLLQLRCLARVAVKEFVHNRPDVVVVVVVIVITISCTVVDYSATLQKVLPIFISSLMSTAFKKGCHDFLIVNNNFSSSAETAATLTQSLPSFCFYTHHSHVSQLNSLSANQLLLLKVLKEISRYFIGRLKCASTNHHREI